MVCCAALSSDLIQPLLLPSWGQYYAFGCLVYVKKNPKSGSISTTAQKNTSKHNVMELGCLEIGNLEARAISKKHGFRSPKK